MASLACEAPESDPLPEDPEVVATFEGGEITRGDLDRAILAMPAADRQALGAAPEPYRRLVRELAVHRVVLERAKLQGGADGPEHRRALRDLERQAHVEQYLRQQPIEVDGPTPDQVRQRYDRDLETYRQPERRHVLNIFRRATPGIGPDQALQQLESVRGQVLSGASFSSLASEVSDSESRHRGGSIGWIERGQLPGELEEIVFGLPEGSPSEPVKTGDGWHLFYVDSAIDARVFSFDEVRALIRQQLLAELREDELDRRLGRLELPEGSFVPEPDELRALLGTGDPAVVVLRLGEYRVTAGELGALVAAEARRAGPGRQQNLPRAMLDRLRRHELIYRQRVAGEQTLSAPMAQRLELQAEQLLADRYRRQLMQQRLESKPGRLRAFYDDNRSRFSGPLRLELRRLVVPFSRRSARHMAVLERRRGDLDAGTVTLDVLAADLGGTIEDLGWKTLAELAAIEPKMPAYIASVDAGDHSPPYRGLRGLEMLSVVDRREPEPLSYELVRARARAAYLERHGGELYAELAQALLEEVGFRLFEERLVAAGLPARPRRVGQFQ